MRFFVFAETNLTQNVGYCPLLYTVCKKVAYATSVSLLGIVINGLVTDVFYSVSYI